MKLFDTPFRHVTLENMIPGDWLNEILDEWPDADSPGWKKYQHKDSCKFGIEKISEMPSAARKLIAELNQQDTLDDLGNMFGHILIPDPWMVSRGMLWGGGLHESRPGGYLNMHVDFNRHPTEVYRRVNLLIYLNKEWGPDWGGELQLSNQGAVASIPPTFGRVVAFETSETSWHGHPKIWTPELDQTRKSIALYYYSAKGEDAVPTHSTIYQNHADLELD